VYHEDRLAGLRLIEIVSDAFANEQVHELAEVGGHGRDVRDLMVYRRDVPRFAYLAVPQIIGGPKRGSLRRVRIDRRLEIAGKSETLEDTCEE
jgi:hypothetical protein